MSRYWHFAVSSDVRLDPMPVYTIKAHVLFSSDGKNIWDAKGRLHRTRRSHCKDWWNPHWRDRVLAAVCWLADHRPSLVLPVSTETAISVEVQPLAFHSPVGYDDAKALSAGDVQEDVYPREEPVEEAGVEEGE